MKLELKGKNKVLIYAGMGVFVTALICYFIFSVLGQRIRQLDSQIKLSEGKLLRVMGIQKERAKFTAECDKYRSFMETGAWGERRICEELLKEVERIAKDSGVSVINLSPEPVEEQGKEYKEYRVSLRVDADLEQLLVLLNKISDDKFLIKVEKLSISPKGEAAELLKIEAIICIVIP